MKRLEVWETEDTKLHRDEAQAKLHEYKLAKEEWEKGVYNYLKELLGGVINAESKDDLNGPPEYRHFNDGLYTAEKVVFDALVGSVDSIICDLLRLAILSQIQHPTQLENRKEALGKAAKSYASLLKFGRELEKTADELGQEFSHHRPEFEKKVRRLAFDVESGVRRILTYLEDILSDKSRWQDLGVW